MATKDNVRVLYRDGLILGADELSDDQTYFRSALERRSLTRDMFGIAWGLDLSASGGTAVVSPGVAYGGDGRVIVVREPENISHLLEGVLPDDYAIYLLFRESSSEGGTAFRYCGEALDPRIVEEYSFVAEESPGEQVLSQRSGARRDPQADLQSPTSDAQGRVRLGVITVGANNQLTLKTNPGRVPCSPGDPDGSARGAEYIGATAATITHPKRWADSSGQDQASVAIEIEPKSGVHLHDPLVLHQAQLWESGSSTKDDFSLGLEALPEPNQAEEGLVLKVCNPNEQEPVVPLLSANRDAINVHVPLVAHADTTLENARVNGDLSVTGSTQLAATAIAGDVNISTLSGNPPPPIGGARLTTDQLTVRNDTTLTRATIDQLIVTSSLVQPSSGTTTFPNAVTFNQMATFLSGMTVGGGATFNAALTVGATGSLNVTGNATFGGTLTAGTTNVGQLVAGGSASLNAGLTVSNSPLTALAGADISGRSILRSVDVQEGLRAYGGMALPCQAAGSVPNGAAVRPNAGTGPVNLSAEVALAAHAARVIGIVAGRDPNDSNIAFVVTSGRVIARVVNSDAANAIEPGDWLVLSATEPGVLDRGGALAAGRLIAKALGGVPANTTSPMMIAVLVALG